MSQQINLLNPVLLTQKRYFSALTMLQGLGFFAAGGVLLCLWLVLQAQSLRTETHRISEQYVAEKTRLLTATQALATPAQAAAVEQELAAARATLAARTSVRDELTKGVVREGYGYAALLRTLAATVPPPLWLTEVRVVDQRIEIAGNTLDPVALNDWMGRLDASVYFAGRPISAVLMESVAAAPATAAATTPAATPAVAGAKPALPPGTYSFGIAAIRPESPAKSVKPGGPAS